MSYRKLEIWEEARQVSIMIHEMTLKLPKFEQFEEAQQIRKSSKSVRSNIVEGCGRRRYKQEFIRFLIFAQASNDETMDHLEILYETKSLIDPSAYDDIKMRLEKLGRKLNNFIKAVERGHNSFEEGGNIANEPTTEYLNSLTSGHPESSN